MDPDVLGQFWIAGPGKTSADAAVDNMYAIMRVKAGKASATEAEQARRTRWEELLRVMQILENQVGWAPQDAKNAYTSDTSASHTSRVLGTCIFHILASEGLSYQAKDTVLLTRAAGPTDEPVSLRLTTKPLHVHRMVTFSAGVRAEKAGVG